MNLKLFLEKEEEKQCLWCGNPYLEGMEGICRDCWEKHQFPHKKEPESDKKDDSENF